MDLPGKVKQDREPSTRKWIGLNGSVLCILLPWMFHNSNVFTGSPLETKSDAGRIGQPQPVGCEGKANHLRSH